MVRVKVLVSTGKTTTHCLTLYSRSPVLTDCCELDSKWTTAGRNLYGPIRPGPTPLVQIPVGGYLLSLTVSLWPALLAFREINFISSSPINSVPHVFHSIAYYSTYYSNCPLNLGLFIKRLSNWSKEYLRLHCWSTLAIILIILQMTEDKISSWLIWETSHCRWVS